MTLFRGWTIVLAAGVVLAGAGQAAAQTPTGLELGTQAGLVILDNDNVTTTEFNIPGGGVQGTPTIYLSAFLSPRIALEPQFAFAHTTAHVEVAGVDVDQSVNTFGGVLRLAGYLQNPHASPYLFADLALLAQTESDTRVAPGFGIGYRAVVGRYIVLRPEARYRKWTDDGPDEIGLTLSFGVLLP